MPMRPAMSVMESTDTPPISVHDAGLDVTLAPAGQFEPGQPVTLRLTIRDSDGNALTDLVRTHRVWSHEVRPVAWPD
jgi:P-type Cu+ transporter